ncbi:MAG: hypothetical protein ABJN42_00165 [Roseibium sp.]|uniref:hypothetical protein n=1 Tax=Roseibium sp. TaxID=1936156 RepID=UPI00329791F6
MGTDISSTTQIPVLQSQSLLPAAVDPSVEASAAAVSAPQAEQNESGLLFSFLKSRSSLEGLGLRTPRNAGDTEALLLEVSLISERLFNNNNAAKGIAQGVAKRNELSEIHKNFLSIESLQSGIRIETEKRDEKLAGKAALEADLPALRQQESDLLVLVSGLSGDPEKTDELSVATQLLNQVREEIGQLEATLGELNGMLQFASFFGEFLGNILLKLLYHTDTQELEKAQKHAHGDDQQEKSTAVLSEFQRVLEIDLEDSFIQDLIGEDLRQDELEELTELTIGLSGVLVQISDVLLQLGDLAEVDLDAIARENNKERRLQLSL